MGSQFFPSFWKISHKSSDFLRSHFPTVMARCEELGIDISSEPIPVVPAAHYTCGGIVVDSNSHTDVPGLYAVGESSCHRTARRQSHGEQFAAGMHCLRRIRCAAHHDRVGCHTSSFRGGAVG